MRREFWNNRYKSTEYAYGAEPNLFFRQELDKLPPGRILLPAEGEGRNAVYAARQGWDVHAFDISPAGKTKADKLAHQHDVNMRYQIASFETYDPGDLRFDTIGLIYAHIPLALRSHFHGELVRLLAPGGCIILEAFTKMQLSRNSGGPKNLNMLYDRTILEQDFCGLKEVDIEELEVTLSEGSYHQGKAHVIRMVGRRDS